MTDLMLPDGLAPSNLHLRESVKTRFVESDVFDIARRVAEISPRLFIVELQEGDKAAWCVMEMCDDGVQRIVKKYDELHPAILPDIARMLSIPLNVRVELAQKEIDDANAKQHEDMLEKLYENMGQRMHRELERCHFIEHRPISYPKLGVAAPGRAR
jgi:hypothetical protein